MAGLSEIRVKNLASRAKVYRVADAEGLCVEVNPSGARYWRYRYRFAGTAKMLSVGTYPEISLKEARINRDKARALLRDGVDPSAHRRLAEVARRHGAATTVEPIAREWLEKQRHVLADITYDKAKWMLESFAFPWIGARPIGEIEATEMLSVLRRVEEQGKLETAHRLKQRCSQIFRYAIATGRAKRDPCPHLRGALAAPKAKNRAAITDPQAFGGLLRAIDGYSGGLIASSALKLAPLVFVRPGELRRAEWAEIDLDNSEWRLPAEKMKMRSAHIVPLSKQAVAILKDLQPLTGRGRYVFPGVRSLRSPMSENTITAALRRMGFSGTEMSGHGFRGTASTLLHEMDGPASSSSVSSPTWSETR